MPASRVRASACTVAVVAAAVAACHGDARRVVLPDAPVVEIGTLLSPSARQLAGILSTEPLVVADWNGRPVARLAESWSESADGRVLKIRLRPDVRFHSGELLTAEHVRRILMERAPLMDEVARIDAGGETDVAFTLKHPYSMQVADLGNYAIFDETRVDLRTGPLKVTSLQPRVVLEPFDGYHGGRPTVARVEIEEHPNHRAAWSAMMRREVNFLHEVSSDAIGFMEEDGDTRVYRLLRPYYLALGFNLRHPVLARREVRVAITEAIDRTEIVDVAMRGLAQPADGPIWPHHWAYPPERQAAAPNREAARVRLESAGFPLRRADPAGMPRRVAFACLVPEGDARTERTALVVQRQLFEIGVDMQLVSVTRPELQRRLGAGDFDAFFSEVISSRTLSWPHRLWHSPAPGTRPLIANGYSAADGALDRMRVARIEADVRLAVAEVMRALREDPPAAFLVWQHQARALDRSIAVPYEPGRDIFGTLWEARSAATAAPR